MPNTYRVRRPIKVGPDRRDPGELCPEAIAWFRVDHLVHAGFLVWEHVEDDELLAALSYCPELLPRYGYPPAEPAAVEAEPEPEPEPEEETLIGAAPEPVKFPRAELEELSWPELRKLGGDAGLGRDATKAEILDALSEGA